MRWLEAKYVGLLSGRLRNFQKKSENLYQFSCPICGDSEKHRNKARGYVYQKRDALIYHCHNCGVTMSISRLLEQVDPDLHDEFRLERLREDRATRPESHPEKQFKTERPVFSADPLKGLRAVSQLEDTDPCRTLVLHRRIPERYHSKLYSCPNFFAFTNTLSPGKLNESALRHDQTRLLIPFIADSHVHAYQGRAIWNVSAGMKYMTIVLNDQVPKVYGLDTVDLSRRVYVFEGPIDSMFVENAVAVAGGDLTSFAKPDPKFVLVYDNEPRSVFTIQKMQKAIKSGYTVCFWPKSVAEKDVNDMVLSGKSPGDIKYMIDENAQSGLYAEATLSEWRRIHDRQDAARPREERTS